jgi:hypothetical protein
VRGRASAARPAIQRFTPACHALQEHKVVVAQIKAQEKGLYEEYFKTISDSETR